jgi:HTH-type transcriptional regulator/antitoxin HipB
MRYVLCIKSGDSTFYEIINDSILAINPAWPAITLATMETWSRLYQVDVMVMTIRNNKEFGEAVRRARLTQNLRQVDLARKASVRQALISEIENGTTGAKLDTVLKVLAALDMDLSLVQRQEAEFDPTGY